MPDRSLDRAIDGLARRQHGAFHRRQAVRIGFTRSMQRTRLASGHWVRLANSEVFALPSHPGSWLRQCMAATLSVPVGAISGPAAMALHGFPGWPRARVEVCTSRGTTHRSPFADVRTTSTVGRIVVVEGIRVVSAADATIHVAPLLPAPAFDALVDEGARLRRYFIDELRERYTVVSHSRLPGIGNLRDALEKRGDGHVPSASELDRLLRDLVSSVPALGRLEWEATPPWLEPVGGRVDVLAPEALLVVEGDGRAWHTRAADFERDRWRDAEALAHGHATLRFTWHQLRHRRAWCRNVLTAVAVDRRGSGGWNRAA